MSLTREQRIAIDLAGTVPIPSPFPALGEIQVVVDGEVSERAECLEDLPSGQIHLTICHRISPKLKINRTVFLENVGAIFLPDKPHLHVGSEIGTWLLSNELRLECLERIGAAVPKRLRVDSFVLGLGIVYVPESAPLLMQVEVGMTAGESVEYYPPLPGEFGADYHKNCNLNRDDDIGDE